MQSDYLAMGNEKMVIINKIPLKILVNYYYCKICLMNLDKFQLK